MENRKIGVIIEYHTKLKNNLIAHHIDAAQAMSKFGMNAQQTFVSLVCDKNNIVMGTICHALGTIRDYFFNTEVALQAIVSIKNATQIWFGRSSPDCLTEFSEKDHEYYRWLSANLLNNNIGSRGLIIITPSGDAKYSDGVNEISFTYEIIDNGELEIPVWSEIFV